MKIFWGGKTKKNSDDRKYKKTWNWDRQIIFWDNWITSITSITPITLITLITPITSITKKNQGPKLKANHNYTDHTNHIFGQNCHIRSLWWFAGPFWKICSTRPQNFGGLKGKGKKKAWLYVKFSVSYQLVLQICKESETEPKF